MCPRVPAHVWAILWIMFEVAVLIGFVLIGIASFRYTPEELQAQAGASCQSARAHNTTHAMARYIPTDVML